MLGTSRQRLAGVLSSAYAEGLLSEHTYSHRVGLLLAGPLVDEGRLVGDLRLLDRRTVRWRSHWFPFMKRAERVFSGAREPSVLLALSALPEGEALIGRHPCCDIVLSDPTVSRRHAQLTHRDGAWVLRDLGSKNGTFVNSARVGRTAVRPGDIVGLGNQSVLVD